MSVKAAPSALWNKDPALDCAFRVMIVYEDYPAGRAAMDTYQLLLGKLGREFDFRISIWRFDVLEGLAPALGAVHDAIDADAIIVATQVSELPAGVKRWIEAWVGRKQDHTAALIALLGHSCGEDNSEPSRACAELEAAARSAGMDFIAMQLLQPKRPNPPPPATAYRLATEGWGLNE